VASLTGAETSTCSAGPRHVDVAYRDVLLERFGFDPSKKVRAYSKGNRQKLILIAALMTRPTCCFLESRPAASIPDGESLPGLRGGSPGAARPSSCRRTS